MPIFLDDSDYQMFFFLLGEVVRDYDLECYDMCLMPNHFHLCASNRRQNLSASMQKLKGEYARYWNEKHRRVGHVFEGPFRDQVVQHDLYFRNLLRYIALNPVRAGLVRAPEEWRWSGYRFTAGFAVPPEFLSSHLVLRHFAPAVQDAARGYVEHVAALPTDPRALADFRSRRHILGDAAFKARFAARDAGRPPRQPLAEPRHTGHPVAELDHSFANLPA